ncbi:hypothetical protein [Dokdonia sp. Asnod2-E02]|uniref:hypothetical protein n=1 Tax=Dokdonia sp. Asnod2-E02 TaxID=3160574 RepID=UPI00386BDDF7
MNLQRERVFAIINKSEAELKSLKIGVLVRSTLPTIISDGLITQTEMQKLEEETYSKITLNVNYAVLKKIDNRFSVQENRMVKNYTRYYSGVFKNGDDEYLIASEWYKGSLENYIKWLKRKVKRNNV